MLFEWVYWMMTPGGKKKVGSGQFRKDSLAGGKRAATNLGPTSLTKAGWRHSFGNVYVKANSYEELVLRAFPVEKDELPQIFTTKQMGV